MASILDVDVLCCGRDLGSVLVGWAEKVQALGDIIQFAHESEHQDLLFIAGGAIGGIIQDYGTMIGALAGKIEKDVTELWNGYNGSNIRIFKAQYESFSSVWRKDVPFHKDRAKSFYDEVNSYIEKHDPSYLYKIRDDLASLLGKSDDQYENHNNGKVAE
jgi:hypothetical protein